MALSFLDNRAESFLQIIRRAERGRLKIYLGYSPGVGKTYQMLQEAHRLKSEGIDAVIGVVETHGRTDTGVPLWVGLEVIPRRKVEYHNGVVMEEMDLDTVLGVSPRLCSWTVWPTQISPVHEMANVTRMCRTCWRRAFTSSAR